MSRIVLDTNAILYWLNGRIARGSLEGALHYSVISELELLSYGGLTPQDELQIRGLLSEMTCVEVSADERLLTLPGLRIVPIRL